MKRFLATTCGESKYAQSWEAGGGGGEGEGGANQGVQPLADTKLLFYILDFSRDLEWIRQIALNLVK